MASRILAQSLKYASTSTRRQFYTTRPYCSGDITESPLSQVFDVVCPSVVGLVSYFSGSGTPSRSTGVFVDRKLIVTTARSVGRISSVYDSDSCSVLHNCVISKTIALTKAGKALRTKPAAVHFAGDLAVLEEAEDLPPPIMVAESTAECDSPLAAMTVRANLIEHLYLIRVVKGVRAKAPWPLAEEVGWVDYGFCNRNVGVQGKVSVEDYSGTPWFNFEKEVAGVSSWAAPDAGGDLKSYMVPPQRIKSIIDYANFKGPHDPIVMDRWIKNNNTISDHNSDTPEEEYVAVAPWPTKFVLHTKHTTMTLV